MNKEYNKIDNAVKFFNHDLTILKKVEKIYLFYKAGNFVLKSANYQD
jgi:hypothetical protein